MDRVGKYWTKWHWTKRGNIGQRRELMERDEKCRNYWTERENIGQRGEIRDRVGNIGQGKILGKN